MNTTGFYVQHWHVLFVIGDTAYKLHINKQQLLLILSPYFLLSLDTGALIYQPCIKMCTDPMVGVMFQKDTHVINEKAIYD